MDGGGPGSEAAAVMRRVGGVRVGVGGIAAAIVEDEIIRVGSVVDGGQEPDGVGGCF